MAPNLTAMRCTPCRGGVPPLTPMQAADLLADAPGWEPNAETTKITKTFKFANFKESLDFVQGVAALAESEFHHPAIHFGWGFCTIELHTKKIRGLHENDFIMAAKIDALAGASSHTRRT